MIDNISEIYDSTNETEEDIGKEVLDSQYMKSKNSQLLSSDYV